MKWWKKKRRKKKEREERKEKSESDLSREAPYRRTKEERELVKFLAQGTPWPRAYFAYPTFQSKRDSTDFPDQQRTRVPATSFDPNKGRKKIKNKKKEERKKRNGERRIWKEEPDNRKFIDRSRCSTRFRSFKLHCLRRAVNLPINPLRFILRFFFSLIFTIISIFTSINTKNINTRTRGHLGT